MSNTSAATGSAFLWTNHPDAAWVKLVKPESGAAIGPAVATLRNAGLASRQVDITIDDLPLVAVFSADQAGEEVVAAQPVVHPQETPLSGSFVFNGPTSVTVTPTP
jgi:hypothetical protein